MPDALPEAVGPDHLTDVLRAAAPFPPAGSRALTPVWQATHGIGPWIWWYNFERIMAAVEDLDCLELLD